MGPATVTGGRLVVEALEHEGIRHAFTVPGESFLGILDALADSRIAVTATRHEGGAAFMAEAYGQYAGLPAACLATRAVGAANLAIGLHTARANSTPLVALVGQAPRAFLGREAFQEVDQVATFGGLCKAAVQPTDVRTLYDQVALAIREARSGRPGPVLVALPEDLLDETVEANGARTAGRPRPWAPERPAPAPDDVRAVLQLLAGAQRPVVLAGGGVRGSGATDALATFLDAADLPVVAGWRRRDVHPNGGPRYLGSSGLSAAATVRERLLAADVILALGTRLSEVSTFGYAVPGPATVLAHVDIAPGLPGDRRRPELAVRSDVRRFLEAALELLAVRGRARDAGLLPGTERAAARAEQLGADREAYLAAAALPERPAPGTRVYPGSVIRALRDLLPPGSIVTTDAGNFAGWAARHLPVPDGGRFLGPTSGAMGYGLPAAIGAAIARRGVPDPARRAAHRDRRDDTAAYRLPPVVALTGDGGFAMLVAEIETAVREGLSLVAIVLDNAMYGTIRMHQELRHPGRVIATDLGAIDFARVAEACGARGSTVARDADAAPAIAAALERWGVSVVHVLTDPRYLSVDRLLQG